MPTPDPQDQDAFGEPATHRDVAQILQTDGRPNPGPRCGADRIAEQEPEPDAERQTRGEQKGDGEDREVDARVEDRPARPCPVPRLNFEGCAIESGRDRYRDDTDL